MTYYEGGSESSVIGIITLLINMIGCCIIPERATFLLYNDVKIIPVRNKYLEIDTLKDTWGKTNGTFSRICEYYCVRFMRHIVITTDQIFSNFTVINNSIFRKAM